MPQALDIGLIATRLEVMEKQHRRLTRDFARLKRTTVACLAVAATTLLVAAAPQQRLLQVDRVEARRFVVRDAHGKERASLGMRENDVQLALSEPDEKPRAMLTVGDGTPILGLFDAAGKQRLGFALAPEGLPRFGLYDQHERQRVAFALLNDGAPLLRLYDASAKLRAALGCTTLEKPSRGAKERTPESSLLLLDAKEQVLFQAP